MMLKIYTGAIAGAVADDVLPQSNSQEEDGLTNQRALAVGIPKGNASLSFCVYYFAFGSNNNNKNK